MTPDQLKQARLQLGLNIKQMAAALGTPYRTYQNWELGERRIPGIVAVAIHGITNQPTYQGAINRAPTVKLPK